MNSLLKRQIRKYLPKDLQNNEQLEVFLDAVNRSYNNSDDQLLMLQRATAISSEELFEASEKLKEETDAQREIIDKLKSVINTLKFYELEEHKSLENSNSLKLVDFIDYQTKEIIKINQQKDKLLENLERQNQELNDYTHMIFHDLISPLQNIETLTHLLKEDHCEFLCGRGRKNINLISENVEKIHTLVKAIRNYSSVNKFQKNEGDLDVGKFLTAHLNNITTKIDVEIKTPEKLPVIKGKVRSLELLFENLIDNSIKFNEKDDKQVEIGYKEKKSFWEFYVKDNGKGIEKEYYKKIFSAFSKLENDYNSAGMGLTIAKKIVDTHEGRIWLESEFGKGSTFYFTLKK